MFRHPNYYKNLRKLARNRDSHVRPILGSADSATDQAISLRARDGERERATGPGHKPQATSSQASSDTPQAPSNKRQAPSRKLQADES
jgi:hypothetical protein